jgi:hypothetical protein
MEINIFYITLTAIMAVLLVGIGVQIGRNDKGESNGDTDNRVCVPDGDRDRSGNNGRNKRMEAEEITSVLSVLRMGASAHEKEVIDYLMDRDAQLLEHAKKLGVRLGGNDEDVL